MSFTRRLFLVVMLAGLAAASRAAVDNDGFGAGLGVLKDAALAQLVPRARVPAALGRVVARARGGEAVRDRLDRRERMPVHLEDRVVRVAAVRLVAHGPVLVPRAVEPADVRPADGGLAAVALVQRRHAVPAQQRRRRRGSAS